MFSFLLSIAAPNATSTPSGCCNPIKSVHPPTVCRQRSIVVAQAGYPPCPESWPSHSGSCHLAQRPAVFQLLPGKNQPLLFRWDTLFVLYLGLNVLNRVIWFDVESDGLSRQRLHENLHRTTSQSKHQVQRRLLLDVVVAQSTTIF